MNDSFLVKKLIAHRGVHYKYIENTIDAFKAAMYRGYIIELDVRLTLDNYVVVFHDANTYRLTGVNMDISKSTYKELKNIMDIPTLKEVLDVVDGRVCIIIEIKSFKNDNKICSLVANILDSYHYNFAIQSFNPFSLYWFKKNRPSYLRGYLVNSGYGDNFFVNFLINSSFVKSILNPIYIGVNLKGFDKKKISKLRRKYLVFGYTVNDKKEYDKYSKYFDNLICNIGKEPYK